MDQSIPAITVVLPVRNEAEYIGLCLDAVIAQDYPKDKLEILVVDGRSTDATREIVARYSETHPYILLVDNPEKNTIAALNIGIQNARGEIIVRVDGHCRLEPDYLSQCVQTLETDAADNVGGLMRPVGKSYVQQAVALATSTIFGLGWGKVHYQEKEQYTDTVYLGAFRKCLFDKIGLYDPEMSYNEDNELNFRIIQHGGKVLLSPKIKSHYYPRDSIPRLAKQYYNYGYYKPKFIMKHKWSVSYRHFIPSLFVASLFLSAISSIFFKSFLYLLYALIGAYAALALMFSLTIALQRGFKYLPALPVIFATIHMVYGIGFLTGVKDFMLGKQPEPI
jgi:succinoglycan biosynthesis protein ExoA